MRLKHIAFWAIGWSLLLYSSGAAQLSRGGNPVSFQKPTRVGAPEMVMPPVDVATLLEEDARDEKLGVAFRFGFPHEVSWDLTNSGVWEELDDGGKLWRLAIRCPGAYSINLVYDRFEVPEGARFFVYTPDRAMVLGAFGSQNVKDHGKFATSPIEGEGCVLEYYVPASCPEDGDIAIGRVVHGYKDVFFDRRGAKAEPGFGQSGDCNVNVHCPEGDNWQNEVRSVGMILTDGGIRLCTGFMINNVREDEWPYFLSANHCLGSEETWIIMFNYESPSCDDIDGPTSMTVQGTTLLSHSDYSDFALLELSEQPPDSFNVFYAGWNAVDTASDSSVAIHHPSGDIKKISFDDDTLIETDYYDYDGDSHWQVGHWELGTTEGGSSGCPLFNWDHQVVGQLHGGYASCQKIKPDWFGQFSESWDHFAGSDLQLKYWLDPDNTGIRVLDGYDPQKVSFTADATIGNVPFLVNFTGTSEDVVDSWTYDFGDGDSAFVQSPSHVYDEPGVFDVKLEAVIGQETQTKTRVNYIFALADSLIGPDVDGNIESTVELEVYAHNTFPLSELRIPVEYGGDLPLVYDSFSTAGCRTEYFATQDYLHYDPFNDRLMIRLKISIPASDPELEPGQGPVVKFYFTIEASGQPDQSTSIALDGYDAYPCEFRGSLIDYQPVVIAGSITATVGCCEGMTGDVDGSDQVDILDLDHLVAWMFRGGPAPVCMEEADVDGSDQVDILDLNYMVNWMFRGGPYPVPCPES